MRGVIIVETMEEYKKWLAEQKPEYYTVHPEKAPAAPDSLVKVAAVLQGNK
jgi:hypothetical protein